MTVSKTHAYFSPEEYLEIEQISPIKHEYNRGEVYAMARASDPQGYIALNLLVLLRTHLRGTSCRVYTGDMKVRIEQADVFYYPDTTVTCDLRDRNSKYFKRYPRLIVEVLSPTTKAFDRGDKFRDYQQSDTLEEYILIAQDRIQVECFRRQSDGSWLSRTYGATETVELLSVGLVAAIAQFYEEDVKF